MGHFANRKPKDLRRFAKLLRLKIYQSHLSHAFDISARPPEKFYFQKDRNTLEKRSGRRLKELVCQSQAAGFDLNAWIPRLEAGGSGRQIPGRN